MNHFYQEINRAVTNTAKKLFDPSRETSTAVKNPRCRAQLAGVLPTRSETTRASEAERARMQRNTAGVETHTLAFTWAAFAFQMSLLMVGVGPNPAAPAGGDDGVADYRAAGRSCICVLSAKL